MSEKVKTQHVARKALLYVRQSTVYQVSHNVESQKLQYAMQERLRTLGWREIEVIDEDLGCSASGTVTRSGFERMVTHVCLGEAGAVAAREVSRFARNSREWQQLVEMCRVVDTLLIDQETVYDPRQSNDRLLLGLKGSLNEYELELLRQRSLEARMEKARRGELLTRAPIGYVKAEGRLEKAPDRRVQEAVLLVFGQFQRLGSARRTFLWFIDHDLRLPAQDIEGETYWKKPSYSMVYRMLTNPAYGGAYAYGKTGRTTHYENGELRRGCHRKDREHWVSFVPNTHEGYVSWEEFERIQAVIAGNNRVAGQAGAVQGGMALLSGLLRCARCGRKLDVLYRGERPGAIRYSCQRGWLDQGETKCIAFGGTAADKTISVELLRAVQPAAVEAAIMASEETARDRDEVLEALQRDLQAARYAAQRAQKQYDHADPENRLVAAELERRWNAALESVRDLETRIRRHCGQKPPAVSSRFEEFAELASELETVWNGPHTDIRLKKRIVRTLIQEVICDVDDDASEVVLIIHWRGGVHTELRLPRLRRGQNSCQTPPEIVETVRILAHVCPDAVIAGALNRHRLPTGRGNRWTPPLVASLRNRHQIPSYTSAPGDWMNLTQAAQSLGVSSAALRQAIAHGEIEAQHPLPDGPWILSRTALETAAAEMLVKRSHRGLRGRETDSSVCAPQLFNDIPR